MRRILAAFVIVGIWAAESSAVSIPLFNTGVDAGGSALSAGSADPHWTLTGSPDGSTTATVPGDPPIGPWVANNGGSVWIAPSSTVIHAGGDYSYQQTFDLTGFSPGTASIGLDFAVDDAGGNSGIYLNGVLVSGSGNSPFNTLTHYTLSSGFVAGLNSLVLVATNGGGTGQNPNPTGVRVDNIIGTVSVPEPTSVVLLGIGALGLLAARRRRRQA